MNSSLTRRRPVSVFVQPRDVSLEHGTRVRVRSHARPRLLPPWVFRPCCSSVHSSSSHIPFPLPQTFLLKTRRFAHPLQADITSTPRHKRCHSTSRAATCTAPHESGPCLRPYLYRMFIRCSLVRPFDSFRPRPPAPHKLSLSYLGFLLPKTPLRLLDPVPVIVF